MQQTQLDTDRPKDANVAPHMVDYLMVVVKRRRMIALITLVTMAVSVAHSLTLSNVYTAKAMILPTQDEKGMMSSMMSQLGGLAGVAAGSLGGANTTDLYLALLRSDAVLEPVVERFKLQEKMKQKYRSDACVLLNTKLAASAGKKDGIITVMVDDTSPQLAADLTNAVVTELGNCILRMNVAGAGRSRSFLEQRLKLAKEELTQAEEELKSFQTANKSLNPGDQAKTSIEMVARLKGDLATREVTLRKLRLTYTEDSREVKSELAALQQLRSQIAQMEGSSGRGALPSVGSAPALGQEYLRRMREFKSRETLVEMLSKQYEMALISESKDMPPFQVLRKATVPERKSKPSRSKLVLMKTAAAFGFSLVLAFLLENISRMSTTERERWKSLVRFKG